MNKMKLEDMTMRDLIAIEAMKIFMINPKAYGLYSRSDMAEACYDLSEKMLIERKKYIKE